MSKYAGTERLVTRLWDWRKVGRPVPDGISTFPDADAKHRLVIRGTKRIVVNRETGREFPLKAPEGQSIPSVTIDSPWVIWTSQRDANSPDLAGWIGNLNSRKIARLAAPALGFPGIMELDDGALVYTLERGDANCVARRDLRHGGTRLLRCSPGGNSNFIEVYPSEFGIGATLARRKPRPYDCLTPVLLATDPAPGAVQPEPIELREECAAMVSVVGRDFVAWDEQRPGSGTPEVAHLYARTSKGSVVDLGENYAATLEVCGDWLYWKAFGDGDWFEIRRWKPGSAPEIIYFGGANGLPSGPTCHDDTVTIVEAWVGPGGRGDQLLEGVLAEVD
jgi:hypothetical protein